MNIKYLALFLFSIATIFSHAQNDAGLEELQIRNLNYFHLNREHVFLHLNKNKFAPKESLWFSAYVYNAEKHLPYKNMNNLNVGLYNNNGELIESKVVFIENGKGLGYFNLNHEKFSSGKYYLKADTEYMQNFKEDLEYVKSFEIIGDKSNTVSTKIKYDLQLLPEGGHLISNVNNTIGLKLIDNNGKGVFFTDAEVFNSKGEKITSFKSNRFGISKFNLTPNINESYKVKLKTEFGDVIEKQIEGSEKLGISLKTNTLLKDQIVFSLQTNDETYKNINGKEYFLSFHQNRNLKGLKLSFTDDQLITSVTINKNALYPGVNIITIFNENYEPILERMVFNNYGLKRKRVSAELKENFIDSLQIRISQTEQIDSIQRLSISTLPKNSISYTPNDNIISALLLEPYVKSNIEDGGYYFTHENIRRRNYDLDLLLLTQGWSKYSWKNIYQNTPEEYYKHQRGFSIKGSVLKRNEKKHSKILLKSNDYSFLEIADIKANNKFEMNNLFVIDSSEISIGLLNSRNNEIKNSSYSVSILPFKKRDLLQTKEEFTLDKINDNETSFELPKDFIKSSVSLDTVTIQSKSKLQKERDLERNGSAFEDYVVVDEDMEKSYRFITDYIATQGYQVNRGPGSVTILSRKLLNLRGAQSPMVIVDGMPLMGDLDLILNLYTSDVETIVFNKTGGGYGQQGSGGIIKIKTKKTFNNNIKNDNLFSFIAKNGYAIEKEFYIPKYTNYYSNLFENYGVIDWQSNSTIKNNSSIKAR